MLWVNGSDEIRDEDVLRRRRHGEKEQVGWAHAASRESCVEHQWSREREGRVPGDARGRDAWTECGEGLSRHEGGLWGGSDAGGLPIERPTMTGFADGPVSGARGRGAGNLHSDADQHATAVHRARWKTAGDRCFSHEHTIRDTGPASLKSILEHLIRILQ
jgi:hypothetical protein